MSNEQTPKDLEAQQKDETTPLTGEDSKKKKKDGTDIAKQITRTMFGGGGSDKPKKCTPCGKALTVTSVVSGAGFVAFTIAAALSPNIWYYVGGFAAGAIAMGATSIGTGVSAICVGRR